MKIILIEDHAGIRVALEMILSLEGFQVVSFDRGELALEHMKDEIVDLVLLDLGTNGISAKAFMESLNEAAQADPSRPRPVVGVLSASENVRFEANRIGADFWVAKPFDHELLIRKIKEIESVRSFSQAI